MPRRRLSKGASKPSKARQLKKKDASIKKWDKYTDIPMDEEDEFHASRDKILLEGDDGDEDDYGDEDEVFALKGMPEHDSDSDEEDEEFEELEELDEEPSAPQKVKKKTASSSEEEDSESSDEEAWGRGKSAYYNSNEAQLDSDDEEGHELEVQEARRIQGKHLELLDDNDFGFEAMDALPTSDDTDELVQPSAENPSVTLPSDPQAALRHIEKINPEAIALARDWDDTVETLIKKRDTIAGTEQEDSDTLSHGMTHLQYQTLLTYTTTLAFYLYLRSSDKYVRKPELLRSHPIYARLLSLKQGLSTLEQLDYDDADDFMDPLFDDAQDLWKYSKLKDLEAEELDDLLLDAGMDGMVVAPQPKKQVSFPSLDSEEDEDEMPDPSPPKKKRKTDKKSTSKRTPVFDVEEPDFSSVDLAGTSKSAAKDTDAASSAFGESTSLHPADAADKARRKKSLRFYTSKIDGATTRRERARNAIGGDDDIPYRERKKEKELREAREREGRKTKLGQGGADLDDVDPEPTSRYNDGDDDMSVDGDGEDGDDFYEIAKQRAKDKKAEKKAKYDMAVAQARELDEQLGEDSTGPRSLTRAILANKGLTPRRPKSVRNPRVKKRQKFEKAQRKVKSQKAVYKGGLKDSGGKYEGERTGISKVVKSVRLG